MSSEVKPSRLYPHRFPRSGFAWWRDSQSSFLFIQSPACERVGRSCWPRVWYGFCPEPGASRQGSRPWGHLPLMSRRADCTHSPAQGGGRARAEEGAVRGLTEQWAPLASCARPDRRGQERGKSGERDVFFRPLRSSKFCFLSHCSVPVGLPPPASFFPSRSRKKSIYLKESCLLQWLWNGGVF